MAATDYKVLIAGGEEGSWSQIGPDVVNATSAEAAIRTVVIARELDGVYVAVPARSWNPTPVKVETTKTVKVGA